MGNALMFQYGPERLEKVEQSINFDSIYFYVAEEGATAKQIHKKMLECNYLPPPKYLPYACTDTKCKLNDFQLLQSINSVCHVCTTETLLTRCQLCDIMSLGSHPSPVRRPGADERRRCPCTPDPEVSLSPV